MRVTAIAELARLGLVWEDLVAMRADLLAALRRANEELLEDL